MASYSTSQISEATNLNQTDLINISRDLGGGNYESKKITVSNAFQKDPHRIIYVALNGSDTTGNGSFHNPYASIKNALANITDNSDANRYIVSVSPGIYVEDNPIQMKSNVNIYAYGGIQQTKVSALNAASNLFTGVADSGLFNFIFGDTDEYAVSYSEIGIFVIRDCSVSGCGHGILINNQYALVDISGLSGYNDAGTMIDLIDVDAGKCSADTLFLVDGTTVTNGIHVTGSNSSVSINNFTTDTVNLTCGVLIDGGSDCTIKNSRITGDSGSRITNAIKATGTDTHVDIIGIYSQHSDFGIYADDGAHIHSSAAIMDMCDKGVYIGTTGSSIIEINGGSIRDSLTLDIDIQSSNAKLIVSGTSIDENKLWLDSATVSMCHVSDNEGDEGTGIKGELHVGSPERPSESCLGEGDSYTRFMDVITTDSTATSTTDGGNLTDVSIEARSASLSTFSFQGTSANHTIIIGSELISILSGDFVKFWGIKVKQTIAAVEVTPKSFTFEYWNGTTWTEFEVMATESNYFYRYANNTFVRANSSEHIRFGLTNNVINWTKKTINGKNLYWVRIRINTTVTTAPVFEQFKLSCNRFEANGDGTNTFHGGARFRRTLTSTGNIFGESGGVTDGNLLIGSGGVPTGWQHNIKSSQFNAVGDALYFQTDIPKGVDTSRPIRIDLKYIPIQSGASTNGSIIVSVLPIEAQGILVADPSFGIVPVERSLVNTASITDNPAVSVTTSVPVVDNTKIQNVLFDNFIISDFYEGDILFIRVEFDDDGSGNKDILILGAELSAVQWKHGDTL